MPLNSSRAPLPPRHHPLPPTTTTTTSTTHSDLQHHHHSHCAAPPRGPAPQPPPPQPDFSPPQSAVPLSPATTAKLTLSLSSPTPNTISSTVPPPILPPPSSQSSSPILTTTSTRVFLSAPSSRVCLPLLTTRTVSPPPSGHCALSAAFHPIKKQLSSATSSSSSSLSPPSSFPPSSLSPPSSSFPPSSPSSSSSSFSSSSFSSFSFSPRCCCGQLGMLQQQSHHAEGASLSAAAILRVGASPSQKSAALQQEVCSNTNIQSEGAEALQQEVCSNINIQSEEAEAVAQQKRACSNINIQSEEAEALQQRACSNTNIQSEEAEAVALQQEVCSNTNIQSEEAVAVALQQRACSNINIQTEAEAEAVAVAHRGVCSHTTTQAAKAVAVALQQRAGSKTNIQAEAAEAVAIALQQEVCSNTKIQAEAVAFQQEACSKTTNQAPAPAAAVALQQEVCSHTTTQAAKAAAEAVAIDTEALQRGVFCSHTTTQAEAATEANKVALAAQRTAAGAPPLPVIITERMIKTQGEQEAKNVEEKTTQRILKQNTLQKTKKETEKEEKEVKKETEKKTEKEEKKETEKEEKKETEKETEKEKEEIFSGKQPFLCSRGVSTIVVQEINKAAAQREKSEEKSGEIEKCNWENRISGATRRTTMTRTTGTLLLREDQEEFMRKMMIPTEHPISEEGNHEEEPAERRRFLQKKKPPQYEKEGKEIPVCFLSCSTGGEEEKKTATGDHHHHAERRGGKTMMKNSDNCSMLELQEEKKTVLDSPDETTTSGAKELSPNCQRHNNTKGKEEAATEARKSTREGENNNSSGAEQQRNEHFLEAEACATTKFGVREEMDGSCWRIATPTGEAELLRGDEIEKNREKEGQAAYRRRGKSPAEEATSGVESSSRQTAAERGKGAGNRGRSVGGVESEANDGTEEKEGRAVKAGDETWQEMEQQKKKMNADTQEEVYEKRGEAKVEKEEQLSRGKDEIAVRRCVGNGEKFTDIEGEPVEVTDGDRRGLAAVGMSGCHEGITTPFPIVEEKMGNKREAKEIKGETFVFQQGSEKEEENAQNDENDSAAAQSKANLFSRESKGNCAAEMFHTSVKKKQQRCTSTTLLAGAAAAFLIATPADVAATVMIPTPPEVAATAAEGKKCLNGGVRVLTPRHSAVLAAPSPRPSSTRGATAEPAAVPCPAAAHTSAVSTKAAAKELANNCTDLCPTLHHSYPVQQSLHDRHAAGASSEEGAIAADATAGKAIEKKASLGGAPKTKPAATAAPDTCAASGLPYKTCSQPVGDPPPTGAGTAAGTDEVAAIAGVKEILAGPTAAVKHDAKELQDAAAKVPESSPCLKDSKNETEQIEQRRHLQAVFYVAGCGRSDEHAADLLRSMEAAASTKTNSDGGESAALNIHSIRTNNTICKKTSSKTSSSRSCTGTENSDKGSTTSLSASTSSGSTCQSSIDAHIAAVVDSRSTDNKNSTARVMKGTVATNQSCEVVSKNCKSSGSAASANKGHGQQAGNAETSSSNQQLHVKPADTTCASTAEKRESTASKTTVSLETAAATSDSPTAAAAAKKETTTVASTAAANIAATPEREQEHTHQRRRRSSGRKRNISPSKNSQNTTAVGIADGAHAYGASVCAAPAAQSNSTVSAETSSPDAALAVAASSAAVAPAGILDGFSKAETPTIPRLGAAAGVRVGVSRREQERVRKQYAVLLQETKEALRKLIEQGLPEVDTLTNPEVYKEIINTILTEPSFPDDIDTGSVSTAAAEERQDCQTDSEDNSESLRRVKRLLRALCEGSSLPLGSLTKKVFEILKKVEVSILEDLSYEKIRGLIPVLLSRRSLGIPLRRCTGSTVASLCAARAAATAAVIMETNMHASSTVKESSGSSYSASTVVINNANSVDALGGDGAGSESAASGAVLGEDSATAAPLADVLKKSSSNRSRSTVSAVPLGDRNEDETPSCLWVWECAFLEGLPPAVKEKAKKEREKRSRVSRRIRNLLRLEQAIEEGSESAVAAAWGRVTAAERKEEQAAARLREQHLKRCRAEEARLEREREQRKRLFSLAASGDTTTDSNSLQQGKVNQQNNSGVNLKTSVALTFMREKRKEGKEGKKEGKELGSSMKNQQILMASWLTRKPRLHASAAVGQPQQQSQCFFSESVAADFFCSDKGSARKGPGDHHFLSGSGKPFERSLMSLRTQSVCVVAETEEETRKADKQQIGDKQALPKLVQNLQGGLTVKKKLSTHEAKFPVETPTTMTTTRLFSADRVGFSEAFPLEVDTDENRQRLHALELAKASAALEAALWRVPDPQKQQFAELVLNLPRPLSLVPCSSDISIPFFDNAEEACWRSAEDLLHEFTSTCADPHMHAWRAFHTFCARNRQYVHRLSLQMQQHMQQQHSSNNNQCTEGSSFFEQQQQHHQHHQTFYQQLYQQDMQEVRKGLSFTDYSDASLPNLSYLRTAFLFLDDWKRPVRRLLLGKTSRLSRAWQQWAEESCVEYDRDSDEEWFENFDVEDLDEKMGEEDEEEDLEAEEDNKDWLVEDEEDAALVGHGVRFESLLDWKWTFEGEPRPSYNDVPDACAILTVRDSGWLSIYGCVSDDWGGQPFAKLEAAVPTTRRKLTTHELCTLFKFCHGRTTSKPKLLADFHKQHKHLRKSDIEKRFKEHMAYERRPEDRQKRWYVSVETTHRFNLERELDAVLVAVRTEEGVKDTARYPMEQAAATGAQVQQQQVRGSSAAPNEADLTSENIGVPTPPFRLAKAGVKHSPNKDANIPSPVALTPDSPVRCPSSSSVSPSSENRQRQIVNTQEFVTVGKKVSTERSGKTTLQSQKDDSVEAIDVSNWRAKEKCVTVSATNNQPSRGYADLLDSLDPFISAAATAAFAASSAEAAAALAFAEGSDAAVSAARVAIAAITAANLARVVAAKVGQAITSTERLIEASETSSDIRFQQNNISSALQLNDVSALPQIEQTKSDISLVSLSPERETKQADSTMYHREGDSQAQESPADEIPPDDRKDTVVRKTSAALKGEEPETFGSKRRRSEDEMHATTSSDSSVGTQKKSRRRSSGGVSLTQTIGTQMKNALITRFFRIVPPKRVSDGTIVDYVEQR